MKVKIKQLKEGAIIPEKASAGAAAYDLYAPEDFICIGYSRSILPLGFALEIPEGYEAMVEPRSGFSSRGMAAVQGDMNATETVCVDADVIPGKIDSDYRGEIGVIIKNNSYRIFKILAGTRLAQLTFRKVETVSFEEADELSASIRGDGGFGSTGK